MSMRSGVRLLVFAAVTLALSLTTALVPAEATARYDAVSAAGEPAAAPYADPSPTPTLGSTERPDAAPSGPRDGDTEDWTGLRWLFLGLLIPVLLIGGVVLAKRGDRKRDDTSNDPPSPRVN